MLQALLQFATLCRAGGLRVSTSEVINAVRCLELIDFAPEEPFRVALRTNFVKEAKDRELFDKIYDLYFHTLQIGADDMRSRALSNRLIDLVDTFSQEAQRADSTLEFLDFLAGNRAAFLQELQKILDLEADAAELSFSDILSAIQKKVLHGRADRLLTEKDLEGADIEKRSLDDLLLERLGIAGQMQADVPPAQKLPGADADHAPGRARNLEELPFFQLTREEAREVHLAIERLARKLRDLVARQYRRKRSGIVDIKRTIRRAARYEGIPLEIFFRRKQKRKAKIVALCDVSYSVWKAVPFMLNILYSVQDCLSRVRSFVFIAQVTDVSETMKDHTIMDAIDRIMARFKLELPSYVVYGNGEVRDHIDEDLEISDYGAAFSQFQEEFLDVLDKKTTLIILGDGRTNFLDPRAQNLEAMRECCRRVIWLNPEPEGLWGVGDSAIAVYRPFCDNVRSCQNLNELQTFITKLVL
ncbi:MAG: VWA domain containing CoxE-like protein [Syntrophus sp. PtaU1.Bin208]|nr:MAG: VWA domain containing CoxE-like protein [Syntrophus sp. PtaU1.Bin208]